MYICMYVYCVLKRSKVAILYNQFCLNAVQFYHSHYCLKTLSCGFSVALI